MISASCIMVYCQIPSPTLVGHSILCILIFKDGKLIFMWALASPHHLPCWGCWEPSDLSDSDDIDEAVNTELLSLSNPQSGDGEGDWGGGSPWSLLHWLQFQPLGGWWGDSWWSEVASPGISFWGEPPCQSNLNGCGVDRFTHGSLDPLPLSGIRLWPRWSPANLPE